MKHNLKIDYLKILLIQKLYYNIKIYTKKYNIFINLKLRKYKLYKDL